MGARRLTNGNILAAVPTADDDVLTDGIAELAPGDPGFAEFDSWLKVYESRDEVAPADDVPEVWPTDVA